MLAIVSLNQDNVRRQWQSYVDGKLQPAKDYLRGEIRDGKLKRPMELYSSLRLLNPDLCRRYRCMCLSYITQDMVAIPLLGLI
jgi:hypothetical protein